MGGADGVTRLVTDQLYARDWPPPGSAAVNAVSVTGVPSASVTGTPAMTAPSIGVLPASPDVSPVLSRVAVAVTLLPNGAVPATETSKTAFPSPLAVTVAVPST